MLGMGSVRSPWIIRNGTQCSIPAVSRDLFKAGTGETKKHSQHKERTPKCFSLGVWLESMRNNAKDGIMLKESSWTGAQALFLHPIHFRKISKPHQQLCRKEIIPVDRA